MHVLGGTATLKHPSNVRNHYSLFSFEFTVFCLEVECFRVSWSPCQCLIALWMIQMVNDDKEAIAVGILHRCNEVFATWK